MLDALGQRLVSLRRTSSQVAFEVVVHQGASSPAAKRRILCTLRLPLARELTKEAK
jgi:hypothetical protein